MLQKQHNATLDGLRGVAALAVCFSHMRIALQLPIFIHGNLAVDFFFILSGFVIDRAYRGRLQTGMSFRYFMTLRIIRLFPLIVLGMALGAAIYGRDFQHGALAIIVTGLLMLPISIAHQGFFPLNTPLWSLLYEFWVNVLYALISKYKFVITALAAFGAALILYITLKGHHHIGVGNTYRTLAIGTGRILWGFFAGVIISRVLTPARTEHLPSVPFAVLALILAGLLVDLHTGPWYDDLCVFIFFPGLLVLGTKDVASGRVRDLALFGGVISYPLYVLHEPLVRQLVHLKSHALPASAAMFLTVLAVSYAASKWYDEPVRRYLGRRSNRLAASVAPPASATD